MTSPRSMFTDAIEDHLALKKQNAHLHATMPIDRFRVGDPLERFPGGPVRAAVGAEEALVASAPADGFATIAAQQTQAMPALSPSGAEAFDAPAFDADAALAPVVEGEFRRPLEPLNGMTPMLSLVEDIEEDDVVGATIAAGDSFSSESVGVPADSDEEEAAPVLRFPGGVGPRETAPLETYSLDTFAPEEAATGEQPVIVIDAEEPLAPAPALGEPMRVPEHRNPRGTKRSSGGGLLGGLRRKKKETDEFQAGWFSGTPRDFSWDD